MELHVYTFIDKDGNEFGSYSTQDPRKAAAYARENNLAAVDNKYTFEDSEVAWDFREEE